MIPQSFIQEMITRVDLVDVVGRHVQIKKGGETYTGLCPFHAGKSPDFAVSPVRQFYHCFGCGSHGRAIDFTMKFMGVGFLDAVRELAKIAGMSVPDSDGDSP